MNPSSHPSWPPLVSELEKLLKQPMHINEILLIVSRDLGWGQDLTLNVLAFGERSKFIAKGPVWSLIGGKRRRVEGPQPTEYQLPKRYCRQCAEHFVPRRNKQVFCGSNCRQKSWSRKAA